MIMTRDRHVAVLLSVLLAVTGGGLGAQANPLVMAADASWGELPVTRDIKPGSILDFSFLNDAPAGKHGRILASPDGHLIHEKTGARVRLVGNNLCFGANFPETKEDADRLARQFQLMGYNTVRFHHIDVDLVKGGWNAMSSDNIDPVMLDRLDYLFAAMKKAGLYISTDLYTMRFFGTAEIPGWPIKGRISGEIKALLPVYPPAFDAWSKYVVKLLTHVNPYTGLAWKDDPALFSLCPLNEDNIVSVWAGNGEIKALYLKKFEEWLSARKLVPVTTRERDALLARFLTETKMESNATIERFLRQLGVKALITGGNWWDLMTDTFPRARFDIVDNHHYWDHPNRHWLPISLNQACGLTTSKAYICPVMKAPSRIFSKPFMLTEYNYVFPNQYRAEGGALFGAYASLQDWDGAYRFAWSHDPKNLRSQMPAQGFDMATDPLAMLTERQVLLMFGRGDVSPARSRYVYAVTMKEACLSGPGDMWARGLFPSSFARLGLVSQVGSQAVGEDGEAIKGMFMAVTAAENPRAGVLAGNRFLTANELPAVANNAAEVVSDTGEILLDNKRGSIRVVAPRTECLVGAKGVDLIGKSLSISSNSTFASFSASSMDGVALNASKRVLLFHLTNVLNTGMTFSDRSMRTVEKWGTLPYLVHEGAATVTLRNGNPGLRLYAVDFSGARTRPVEAEYKEGVYRFQARTVTPGQASTMIYELAAE